MRRTLAFALLLVSPLAACSIASQSPSVGGSTLVQAASYETAGAVPSQVPYVLVDLSGAVIDALRDDPPSGVARTTPVAAHVPSLPLGVGDVVQITIFESQAGGLFIPASTSTSAGNYVALPQQTVDQNGWISVPYSGNIKVAGMSISAVQREIEARLRPKAIEPQVIVSLVSRKSAEVSVMGDVVSPGTFQIDANGDRMLDMLSRAGGLKNAGFETSVSLQRAGNTTALPFNSLMERPADNVYVQPGDVIYALRQPPFFLVYGASGKSGRYDFGADHLSLAGAIGQADGLSRDGTGPRQVYVYRLEDRAKLESARLIGPATRSLGDKVPVIYRASLRDPAGLFVAQTFLVRNKDVVYSSNALGSDLDQFVAVLQTIIRVRADGTISAQ